MIRAVPQLGRMMLIPRPTTRTIGNVQFMSGEVKSAGGSFSKKETAEEERYIREHERETAKKYEKEQSKYYPTPPPAPAPKPPISTTLTSSKKKSNDEAITDKIMPSSGVSGSVKASSGSFSKKEAAQEEKYFRDLDKQRLSKYEKEEATRKKK
ncbi:hypothetical protein SeMB42_g03217 [Synchytrium endobioticum]|uniref:ATPase inhibitor, mitochondrial n=1 Tax=Synchytrium endobioticum TaxID=286115 RepID=A0A507D7Z7_9FUNG|nr:hypothetical protein SeLEV6574_g07436 [Synchytrium endobioticum]TPX47719.1 hypothetical protein SeMB42_g03217 [Synchytrium endobioticum]